MVLERDCFVQHHTQVFNAIFSFQSMVCTIQFHNTIQYNTIKYNTIQYNTIQYNAMQCNAMQCNTIQLYFTTLATLLATEVSRHFLENEYGNLSFFSVVLNWVINFSMKNKYGPIGHLRVLLCLGFITSLSAKPFIWKWVLHAVSFHANQSHFRT